MNACSAKGTRFLRVARFAAGALGGGAGEGCGGSEGAGVSVGLEGKDTGVGGVGGVGWFLREMGTYAAARSSGLSVERRNRNRSGAGVPNGVPGVGVGVVAASGSEWDAGRGAGWGVSLLVSDVGSVLSPEGSGSPVLDMCSLHAGAVTESDPGAGATSR